MEIKISVKLLPIFLEVQKMRLSVDSSFCLHVHSLTIDNDVDAFDGCQSYKT